MKRSLLFSPPPRRCCSPLPLPKPAGCSWSVGMNVPPVATYVSGGPGWYPAPVRYAPPVIYAPAPVYAEPYLSVYDAPYGVYAAPVYFAPAAHTWRRRAGTAATATTAGITTAAIAADPARRSR